MGLSLKCHLPIFVGQRCALSLPHLAALEDALSLLAWPLRGGFECLAAGAAVRAATAAPVRA